MKVGDKVVWLSSWTKKSGIVIADIPSGESAMRHIPAGSKKSHSKSEKDISTIDRMLVAVKAGKEGRITHYYAPRKSLLRVVEEN